MNYARIFLEDVANGPGCRTALFVSGCRRHCPGCHNEEAWDFGYGKPFTPETMKEIMETLKPEHVQGLSILGGEPFEAENMPVLTYLACCVKDALPDKDIWVWSGYKWEDIKHSPLLRYCDVLVDGPFIEAQRDLTLAYRGSANQRIICVPESQRAGKVVYWKG
jgi:anaerobic ribonucleoside-triphosphate reductase activating protein